MAISDAFVPDLQGLASDAVENTQEAGLKGVCEHRITAITTPLEGI